MRWRHLHGPDEEHQARRPLAARGHLQAADVEERQPEHGQVGGDARDGEGEQQRAAVPAPAQREGLVEAPDERRVRAADQHVGDREHDRPHEHDPEQRVVDAPEATPDAEDAAVEEQDRQLDGAEPGLLDHDHCDALGLVIAISPSFSVVICEGYFQYVLGISRLLI